MKSSAYAACRRGLPDALESFCRLRETYPDLSLRDLGEMADPPLSKSALYHRVLRLEKMLEAARSDGNEAIQ